MLIARAPEIFEWLSSEDTNLVAKTLLLRQHTREKRCNKRINETFKRSISDPDREEMRASTSPIAYKYPIFGTLIVIMTSISLRMFKEI